ncbi:MAG: PAS domain S-box protein, partial [Leptospiraceae bacterium]|nr:PAS domain S-box protein [Leptospiraceae bacterium]
LFAPGTGLPGHVGRKDEPVIWKHLGEHPNFLRREAALEAGIRCGAGIPLNAAGLTGSLILLDQKQRQPAFSELQVYKALREFLAREILRKQKEEEMSFLFEGGPDLMAVVGTEGRFIKVNPAFCRTLGYSADEITSRPFTDFLHPEDAKGTLKEYKETITGDRRAHGFINRYRTSDGNYRWISWTSSGVFGLDGHVFAYGRDISQRMDYMHTLENQNTRLREIAWIQSHVVRAPLARLIGLIELLKSGQNSEQDRSWILQSIAESGQELDSIIG